MTIDVSSATDGIGLALTAVASVYGALVVMAAAQFGLKKVYALIGGGSDLPSQSEFSAMSADYESGRSESSSGFEADDFLAEGESYLNDNGDESPDYFHDDFADTMTEAEVDEAEFDQALEDHNDRLNGIEVWDRH